VRISGMDVDACIDEKLYEDRRTLYLPPLYTHRTSSVALLNSEKPMSDVTSLSTAEANDI
jgi:hypothetical protein